MAKNAARSASNDSKPGTGHNLKPEDRHNLLRMNLREHRAIMEIKQMLKARESEFKKLVKTELGQHGLEQIKTTFAMESDPDKAKKIKAKQAAISEAVAWVAGQDGQFDMFNGQPKPTETEAYLRGKIDALDGLPNENSYGPGTADAEDYANGYAYGTAVVKTILETREERAQLIHGPAHDDGRDLDEDEAA